MNPHMVTTALELEGYRITRNLGLVRGIIVRSRSILGTLGASLQTIVGGNITLLTNLCEQTREQSFDLMLTHADVEVTLEQKGVRIVASAATTAQTGVEMEALTAASVAALTVYDMTKALDKAIEIQDLYLLEKTGGKSGDFRRKGKHD